MSSLCFIHNNYSRLPPDVRISGDAKCTPGAPLHHFAYFLHYGVSPTGPYHTVSGHEHGDGLTSHLLMQHALHWFRESVHGTLTPGSPRPPILVVYSSLAWDLGRRMEHFREQPSEAWLHEYRHNYSAAVRSLRGHLHPNEHLLLVADYGCEHAEGGSDSFCARWGATVAHDAADAVESVGKSLGIPVVNLEASFRPRLKGLLERQPASPKGTYYYMHPNLKGACAFWHAIRTVVDPGVVTPPAPACARIDLERDAN